MDDDTKVRGCRDRAEYDRVMRRPVRDMWVWA
jgi:hypothetical protein